MFSVSIRDLHHQEKKLVLVIPVLGTTRTWYIGSSGWQAQYSVKNFKQLAEELSSFRLDDDNILASHDVVALFTALQSRSH